MRASVAILAAAAAVISNASPFPQGVTSAIAPSASAPAGCSANHPGYFGIAVSHPGDPKKVQQVMNRRDARPQVVTSISDGQLQVPTSTSSLSMTTAASNTASASKTASASNPASTSNTVSTPNTASASNTASATNGASTSYSSTTTITLTDTVTVDCGTSSVCITISTVNSASGKTASTLSTITTSQLSNTQTSVPGTSTTMIPVSQISDGQIQATTATMDPPSTTSVVPVTTISDGQILAPPSAIVARNVLEMLDEGAMGFFANADALKAQPTPVACESNKTLSMQLRHGVLTDHKGRTGYIASNYQFQFDAPAQAGAIYTAGWSLCSNGSLALGGSTVFYQCLSGNFYNLYDRYWAAQCEPIELVMVKLLEC